MKQLSKRFVVITLILASASPVGVAVAHSVSGLIA